MEIEGKRRWLWLENLTGTISMPADADNVALPASVKFITSLAYLSGNVGYDILQEMPPAQVRQLARGTSTGSPTYYSRVDNQLYFDTLVPELDQFELVFTSGCPKYIDLAIVSPPITLTLQTPAVIALAAHFVALTYLKKEEEAARQLAAYERIMDRLMLDEDTARADGQAGGSIIGDDYYHVAAHGEC